MAENTEDSAWRLPAWVTARGPIRSESEAIARQRRRDRARAPLTRPVRMRLIDEAKARCTYCRGQGTSDPWYDSRGPDGLRWHFDHWVPLSRGGSLDLSNVVLACATCNARKYDQTGDEFLGAIRG